MLYLFSIQRLFRIARMFWTVSLIIKNPQPFPENVKIKTKRGAKKGRSKIIVGVIRLIYLFLYSSFYAGKSDLFFSSSEIYHVSNNTSGVVRKWSHHGHVFRPNRASHSRCTCVSRGRSKWPLNIHHITHCNRFRKKFIIRICIKN